jgi:cyclopropane-fatty-acyl-phospholipid synthase
MDEATEVIGPKASGIKRARGLRARTERRVMRRFAARLDGVELFERIGEMPSQPPLHHDTHDLPGISRSVSVWIHDYRAYSCVARGGSSGLGEAYFRGWWSSDDAVAVLRAMIRAQARLDHRRNRVHHFFRPAFDPLRKLRRSNKHRDRKNVRAHYDLSNEFFEMFLDETMTYSSGIFASADTKLADASRAKIDRLCEKLEVDERTALLEIGTGWGSFAMRAASRYGALVTTTTISANQAALARDRIADAGLERQIDLKEQDYRDLDGHYDRLVSVEMIEAVDWRDVPTFFATCSNLLKGDGLMGLQAIVVADQRYHRVRASSDFITDWIFPGGSLPSISSIANDVAEHTDMRILDLEDLGIHYAETLWRWRRRLHRKWAELESVGLSDEMARLWDFYLAYCEAGFRERHVSVVQIVLAKPEWRPQGLATRKV